jgi:hypothetical protein
VGSYYDPKPAGGDVFVTGQPIQGQTLTAQHTLTDPDGLTSAGLLGWVWRADGVPVTGVTSSATLLLTQAHVGREISVEAVYRDNAGNIGYVASSPTAEVGLAIDSRADLAGVLASAGVVGARGAAVTGSTYHWNSHILLEDVQVATQAALVSAGTGAGAPKAPAADTSADGRWTVDSLDFDVLLRVSASRAVDPGEAARAINAADVLAALKLASGRAPNPTQGETGTASLPLSPYQVIAADINRDGKVTTDDALGILKIAVGATESPAPVWRFAAESETLWNAGTGSVYTRQSVSTSDGPASAKSGQEKPINLVGVLTGDVDGSWRPGSAEALPAGGYDQLPLEYFQSLGLTPEALAQFGIAMV